MYLYTCVFQIDSIKRGIANYMYLNAKHINARQMQDQCKQRSAHLWAPKTYEELEYIMFGYSTPHRVSGLDLAFITILGLDGTTVGILVYILNLYSS